MPHLPMRQWVLLVPKRVGYFLQNDPAVETLALHVFLRAVDDGLRQCRSGAVSSARMGAVAFIYRFDALLSPQVHFYCVVVEGVREADGAGGICYATAPDRPWRWNHCGKSIPSTRSTRASSRTGG